MCFRRLFSIVSVSIVTRCFFLLRSSEPERNFTVSYSDVRSGMFRRGMANAECSTQNARLGMLNGVFNGMFEH